MGATQGIGRELAAEYARRGKRYHRTVERAEAEAARLEAETGSSVSGSGLDLSRPDSVAGALVRRRGPLADHPGDQAFAHSRCVVSPAPVSVHFSSRAGRYGCRNRSGFH
ncbi:hypothetical protein [Micromonospora vinacea]|uniref:hypothetical protein n=1 Tax=Micromonospora vinacea TaxID=709878 RepID=UPI0018C90992